MLVHLFGNKRKFIMKSTFPLFLISLIRNFQTVLSFNTLKSVSQGRNYFHPLKWQQTRVTLPALHLSTTSTTQQSLPQGLIKTISTIGTGRSIRLGDIVTVQYHAYLPIQADGDNLVIPITIAKSQPKQKVIVGDGMMIAGWDAALLSMNVGERAIVRVEDSLKFAYGEKGVPPIVPPNALIEMDIQILDAEEAPRFVSSSGMGNMGVEGSGEWSLLDPSKPRTPEAIAAAYKLRQDQAAMAKVRQDQEETSTLQGWIEKAKTFYFFGFFEGETGQKAPWFLRPSITFPLAFALVGAAFYVMVSLGGITERGAQVVDELDQVIL